nr:hypothetical protein [Tanacetum cinerariifolium]
MAIRILIALKDALRKLKGKALADDAVTSHSIAPEMLNVDVEPLNPRLLNNRLAHSDYLKHTQEEAAILREIMEQRKSKNPLNGVKPYTSASGSQPSGNTKKDKNQRPPRSTQKNKVEAHPRTVKSSLKNKNCAVEPKRTASVQHSKLNVNYELKCVTCNGCIFFDNHDLCVLDFINNMNAHTITVVGNECPLTRITTTTEVPYKKSIVVDTNTLKPVVTFVYSRKYMISKSTDSASKSKVVKTIPNNKKEPNKSWGSTVSNVPSSSLDECRLSKIVLWYLDSGCSKHMTEDRSQLTNFVNKFLGTVKFRNDYMAKILGYQIGNVMILRVYYVEGLGHNLFSVGQFCDSNLEALKTKSWLWHRRLSHLKFGVINHLSRQGLVRGLPKLKFEKDHMCSACAMGKSKKKPHKPKSEDTNQEKLYLLHMDPCRPMSKDEASDFIIKFLKMIQVRIKVPVRRIRTDNGIIKLYVNIMSSENLGKLQPKADIGIFIGYAPTKKAFGIYNRRTRRIIETIHVDFDELIAMTSEQRSLGPALHEMIPVTISLGLVPNPPSSTPFVPPLRTYWDMLFQPLFDELLTPPPSVDHPALEVITPIAEVVAPEPAASTDSPSSTTVDQDAPSPSNSQTPTETQSPIIPKDVKEDNHDLDVAHMNNDPFFGIPIPEVPSDQSSSTDIIHTIVHPNHQFSKHNSKWTNDHPLENIIGQLARPVSTRLPLHEQALFYYYDTFLTSVEPKTYKDALTQSCWIEAMQ